MPHFRGRTSSDVAESVARAISKHPRWARSPDLQLDGEARGMVEDKIQERKRWKDGVSTIVWKGLLDEDFGVWRDGSIQVVKKARKGTDARLGRHLGRKGQY